MSVASRSATLMASLGKSVRGVSIAGDEDSELLRSVHSKPRPIGSQPVNSGEYSVIERTQAKKDVWVVGYYHPVQRTLRLDVLNQRTTPIIVRMEWTGQNDNVQFIEGGVGKVFVPSKNEITYAQLKVINRSLKWSYRYMLYLTEDAEPLDNEIEYEKNKIDLAESVHKFDELRISPKALHEPEFVVRICEEANVGFIDKDFPPTFSSLYSPEAALELELSNERLIWKRARDFLGPNAQLFEAGIEPADVRQGKLAECWFTCALAALAEHDELIKERFVTKVANKAGLYQISLYKSGTPVKVLVDDYFPCFPDGGPAYSRNHGNELWVMLLEKAYAKLHGSYSAIRTGVASEAMQDLTGCPAETFYFFRPAVQEEIKSGDFFAKLEEFHRRGNLITTRSAEDLDSDDTGLVAGHYYTVLDVKTFGAHKLVKLRNPWGDFEWRGKWSDNSAEWTADAKMALHAPKVEDDGEFWMSFDDFIKHFRSVCVCYWRPGMQSYRLDGSFRPNSVTGRLQNESYRVVVKDKQSIFVGLHQLDARLPNAPQPYFSVGVMIFDKFAKRVLADSGVKPTRMAQVEVRLDAGEYTLIPYALGKGENVRNPKDLYRPFTLTLHTAGALGGFSTLDPDMTPVDAAFVQSAKKNGKAIACRPGVTLYDWCGKKHFILAVEMTEEWKKGPIKFTCALKQSSNLKLANGTSWSVVLNKAGDAAFLNMGVAHDETQPWVYVYTWTYEGK